MTSRTFAAFGLALLPALGLSDDALAHGVHLAERADVPTVVYGGPGTDDAHAPAALTAVRAFAAGAPVLAKAERLANVALNVGGEAALLAAAYPEE